MDSEVIANRCRSRHGLRPFQMSNSLAWGLIGQWAIEFITFFIEMWSPDYIHKWAKWLKNMRLTCRVANDHCQPWPNLLQLCYCYWRPTLRISGACHRPWYQWWVPHPFFEPFEWPSRYRAQLVLQTNYQADHSCFDGLLHPLKYLLRPSYHHPSYQDLCDAALLQLDFDEEREHEDNQFCWCVRGQAEHLRRQVHHSTFDYESDWHVVFRYL
jgi:hypothetical protein